jgi:hypothetical protein
MLIEEDLQKLKNKIEETDDYKEYGKKLFYTYLRSLFLADYQKHNIIFKFLDYKPLSKSFAFHFSFKPSEFNEYSFCNLNVNLFIENNSIKYFFKEDTTSYIYNEFEFQHKKYLMNLINGIIQNIELNKIKNTFKQILNYKKVYLKLERDLKNKEEEYNNIKYRKYKEAITLFLPTLGIEKAKIITENYIDLIEHEINTIHQHRNFGVEPIYNILKYPKCFYYFDFNKDTLIIRNSNINFNVNKNNKIEFKVSGTITSKKQFILALSNQFFYKNELVKDINTINEIDIFFNNKKNNNLTFDLIEISKPLMAFSIASQF